MDVYLGQIILLPYRLTPFGFLPCAGQLLPRSTNPALHSLVGDAFGGDAGHFRLPDYTGEAPPGSVYHIAVQGILPSRRTLRMDPYLGQVAALPDALAPPRWEPCKGQLLPVARNRELFQLMGNAFGGDGKGIFALPEYSGLAPAGLRYCIAMQGAHPGDV